MRAVPFNPDLAHIYKMHLIAKRTQGGGEVARLTKYAFKTTKEHEIVINRQNEYSESYEVQKDT